ncbi:response regulator [Geoalkalibacter subterraneus]|uniref:Response regulatory domain-containing protein n=1 Tax=Geoalkalibacter subterraneus TaxID=483547 RepID=A0A0B5FI29_9BACT|nr:response regulator [Geoalkalibacter subterraneus]AJF07013.1 hypothetical protein GSUB_11180 [Geoalkalibacter subterraneus]
MSKKLLLADDSITIQKVIGITFANEDVDLAIADNGDTALEMAQDQKPDLILADVLMPGKDGYELCEAIKKDSQFKGVPVLLLSGTFEPFDEDKARASGADDWIAKPFESQALIDKVNKLLQRAPESLAVPASAQPSAEEPPVDAELPAEGESEIASEEAGVWGEFSFDEEEMAPEKEPAPVYDSGSVGLQDVDGQDEEDILELDDADILEEEAGPTSDETDPFPFQEGVEDEANEDFGLVSGEMDSTAAPEEKDFSEGLAEAEEEESFPLADWDNSESADDVEEEIGTGSREDSFAALLSDDQSDEFSEEQDLQQQTPEPFFTVEDEEPGAVSEETLETGPAVSQPAADSFAFPAVSQDTPASGATVAAAPPQLDEERVEAIVQKVADEVVNRLAGSILEKVAWEVVPDLAESLIKDEIRKIKDALK